MYARAPRCRLRERHCSRHWAIWHGAHLWESLALQHLEQDGKKKNADVGDLFNMAWKQSMMSRLSNGQYADDQILDYLQNKENKALVFTNNHLIYISIDRQEVRWSFSLVNLTSVSTTGMLSPWCMCSSVAAVSIISRLTGLNRSSSFQSFVSVVFYFKRALLMTCTLAHTHDMELDR